MAGDLQWGWELGEGVSGGVEMYAIFSLLEIRLLFLGGGHCCDLEPPLPCRFLSSSTCFG